MTDASGWAVAVWGLVGAWAAVLVIALAVVRASRWPDGVVVVCPGCGWATAPHATATGARAEYERHIITALEHDLTMKENQ